MDEHRFQQWVDWTRYHMVRTRAAVDCLPDLTGVRMAFSIHLDRKMIPLIEGILQRGAAVYLTTCNPDTVRDQVVSHCARAGARTDAVHGMSSSDYLAAARRAIEWGPTHLCEMGGELSTAYAGLSISPSSAPPAIRGSLEATGSGITRIRELNLPYPIFNWDDIPVKEGLHNRHMVGITAWHTFFSCTGLTLHGKRVLVVGYGSVGRGVADAARSYGAAVMVCEKEPGRALEARFDGRPVVDLKNGIAGADVVVTATGAERVLTAEHLSQRTGDLFLMNVGHRADEIDLGESPCFEVLPHVHRQELPGRGTVFLFARGSMANLVAGEGDSINAFDITLAVLAHAVGFLVTEGAHYQPGLHLLPDHVWQRVG